MKATSESWGIFVAPRFGRPAWIQGRTRGKSGLRGNFCIVNLLSPEALGGVFDVRQVSLKIKNSRCCQDTESSVQQLEFLDKASYLKGSAWGFVRLADSTWFH